MHIKHDEDFYGWAVNTALLLREGRMSEIDIDSLIEEMDDMASSEKRQLVNRLSVLIAHLLKWQFQPAMRGHSWIYTIKEQRLQAKDIYIDNPSLKNKLSEILVRAYSSAIYKAARDTGFEVKIFPKVCPYTFEQIMDEDFYPEIPMGD